MHMPSGENATELTNPSANIAPWISGHVGLCPVTTLGNPWNMSANLVEIRAFVGENGSADRYRWGVLAKIAPPNVRINFWASAVSSKMSL